MKRNLMVAGFMLACTMLFGAKPVHAATIVASGGAASDGAWNVTVTPTGVNTWHVTAVASANTPAADAEQLTVTFFDSTTQTVAHAIPVTAVVGGTVPGGVWIPGVGSNASWDTHISLGNPVPFPLFANGSNVFQGDVTLGAATPVVSIRAALDDTSFAWSGSTTVAVTPEPGTLALALPGIMPFGLMLLKRRRRSEDSVAEELAA